LVYTPFIWPLVVSGLLMLALAVFVLRFKTVAAAGPIGFFMAAAAGWALVYALAISVTGLAWKSILCRLFLVFGLAATSAALVMVLEYMGKGYLLTRKRLLLLGLLPALLLVLVLTSPWHRLFIYDLRTQPSGGIVALRFSKGPLYPLYVVYQGLVTLASAVLIVLWSLRERRELGNGLLVAVGLLLPTSAAILYALGLSPVNGLDIAPMTLVLTGLLYVVGIFGRGFLDTTYIARRLVLDNIQDLVIVRDGRGLIVDLNEPAREALGLGGRAAALPAPGDLPPPWTALLAAHPPGWEGRVERELDLAGGRRVFDLSVSTLADGRGRKLGSLFLLRDVTARRGIELGLRESEEKFRMLADTTTIGMYIYDGSKLLVVNGAFSRITGYAEEELAGRDPLEVVHPEMREIVRQRAASRLKGEGPPQRYEVKILTRGGEARWVDLSVGTIAFKGRPALLATFLDITEKRALAEGLRRSQALYLGIVEDQTDPVCRWLPDSTLTFVNKAYCDYFGMAREDCLGRPFLSWCTAEAKVAVREAVDCLLRREAATVSKEEINYDLSGNLRCMAWAYRPIEDAEGRIVEFQSVGRDISDRMRAELALRRVNEELSAQLERNEVLQARLLEQAVRDVLTGLFNRRYMVETLEREIAGALRCESPISIIMLDLDRFKEINDNHGHRAGDLVLAATGKILLAHTRQMDIACRFGGEEFVIIMPTTPLDTARDRAESIRKAIEGLRVDDGGGPLRVTASAGVATFPFHGCDGEATLRAADLALYAAKASGRNTVVVAEFGESLPRC
jgi:diguanylate cyclase (GGDEF)-like protein/PAS domain S-box-containing protein